MGRTNALRFSGSALSPMPMTRGAATSPMTTPGSSHSPMPHGRSIPSPELAAALRRSRSGMFMEGDDRKFRLALGGSSIVKVHHRWEPQVRIDTGVAAMMCGLSFTTNSDAAFGWTYGGTDDVIHLKAPGTTQLKNSQLPMVFSASDQRDDRMSEILTQAEGLWPFWTAITNIDSTNAPATAELIQTLLEATHLMVMRLKYALKAVRPVDLSSALGPIIPTPGHGSFPSGHATVSFMFAGIMERLLGLTNPPDPTIDWLKRLAHRVAQNRVVAGVHYPVDSVAGRLVGETLAEFFYSRCTQQPAKFIKAQFYADSASDDVNLEDEPDSTAFATRVTGVAQSSTVATVDLVLKQMWDDATAELKELGLLP